MIREKNRNATPVIDLPGPEGNAFCLMGYARKFAAQLGLNSDTIIQEMMGGDYENLVQVFEDNFGNYVILER